MSPDTKFKKTDTAHYELVFPENMEGKINSIGAQLEKSYEYINQSLGLKKSYKISVIFNNKSAYSNAFVTLAPEYSLFYTLPPQLNIHELFYDDWIKLLAVHEMRHAAQFHKLNYGFNRVLYVIFGDYGLAAGMGLSAPGWFFEGDAVYMETALTDFGRGRLASFPLLTRSMLLSGEIPNYDRMYLGSDFKTYPNIYEFGYLMTAWLRKQYGDDVYDEILKFSSIWNVLTGPYAFHLGVYYKTGKTLYENYRDLLSFLSENWKSQLNNLPLTGFEPVKTDNKKYFTNYIYPHSLSKNGITYAYKVGKFNRGAIVEVYPDGREKVITFTGNLTGSISVNKESIIWSEQEPDLRWDESRSVVKWFDMEKKTIHTIKTGGRLFAPSASNDDRFVTGMQVDQNGDSFLVIFEKKQTKANVLEKIKAPNGSLWQTPRFGNSSEKIAFVESTSEGKSIVIYDLVKKQLVKKFRPIKHQISDPFINGDQILFHSDIKGIDNIFAVSLDNGGIKQITSVILGAFYPHVSGDGSYIYFSNFSRLGNDIARMPYQPEKWTPVTEKDLNTPALFVNTDTSKDPLSGSIFQDLSENQLKVTNYPDFLNFLNFHSRSIDPFEYILAKNIRVSLTSSNKLQTHFVNLFYSYNTIENSHLGGADWTFRGWFPVITLGGDLGNRNYVDNAGNRFSWINKSAHFQFVLPFLVSRGPIDQSFQAGTQMSAGGISDFVSYNGPYTPGATSSYHADWFFSYNFSARGNPRLFDSPFFNFGMNISNTPGLAFFNKSGSAWDETAYISIPGFFNNNAITIFGGGSQRTYGVDPFFNNPGYTFRAVNILPYSEKYFLSADYNLPLAYPDLDIFHVLYLRQVVLDPFYEHLWVKPYPVIDTSFLEADFIGGDLLARFNLFELKSDIVGGVRVVYDPRLHSIMITPILSIAVNASF